jgi:hypothetical protein
MVRPVLLAVDDEPAARSIEAELRKRYGADYEVMCEGSGAKRVAGAVGEGSVAIRLVHEYLTRR